MSLNLIGNTIYSVKVKLFHESQQENGYRHMDETTPVPKPL